MLQKHVCFQFLPLRPAFLHHTVPIKMAIIVGHSTGQVFVAQTKDQVVKQLEDLSKKAAGVQLQHVANADLGVKPSLFR